MQLEDSEKDICGTFQEVIDTNIGENMDYFKHIKTCKHKWDSTPKELLAQGLTEFHENANDFYEILSQSAV
eukprot:2727392-Karenia_brevis.AAC.1